MYCPKCGQEVGEYSRICPACGELLETEPAGQPQPGSQNAQQPQPDYNNGQPLQPNYNNYQQPQPNYSNSPQPQPNNYQQMPVIPDYKVQCICLIVFSAICCFSCVSLISLAFAIVAIVNSGKITQHLNMGNYDLAMEASKKTKMWCWISFGVLMLSIVVTAVSYIAILSSPEYQEMLDQIMNMQYQYD